MQLQEVILLAQPVEGIRVKPAEGVSYRTLRLKDTITLLVVNTTGQKIDQVRVIGAPETVEPKGLFNSPVLKAGQGKNRMITLKPYDVGIYQWIQKP